MYNWADIYLNGYLLERISTWTDIYLKSYRFKSDIRRSSETYSGSRIFKTTYLLETSLHLAFPHVYGILNLLNVLLNLSVILGQSVQHCVFLGLKFCHLLFKCVKPFLQFHLLQLTIYRPRVPRLYLHRRTLF